MGSKHANAFMKSYTQKIQSELTQQFSEDLNEEIPYFVST